MEGCGQRVRYPLSGNAHHLDLATLFANCGVSLSLKAVTHLNSTDGPIALVCLPLDGEPGHLAKVRHAAKRTRFAESD